MKLYMVMMGMKLPSFPTKGQLVFFFKCFSFSKLFCWNLPGVSSQPFGRIWNFDDLSIPRG